MVDLDGHQLDEGSSVGPVGSGPVPDLVSDEDGPVVGVEPGVGVEGVVLDRHDDGPDPLGPHVDLAGSPVGKPDVGVGEGLRERYLCSGPLGLEVVWSHGGVEAHHRNPLKLELIGDGVGDVEPGLDELGIVTGDVSVEVPAVRDAGVNQEHG